LILAGAPPQTPLGSAVFKLGFKGSYSPTSKGGRKKRQGKEGKSYILLPNFFNFFCTFSNILVVITHIGNLGDRSKHGSEKAIQVHYHLATQSPQFDVSFSEKLLKIVATRGKIFSLKFTKYHLAAELHAVGDKALPTL